MSVTGLLHITWNLKNIILLLGAEDSLQSHRPLKPILP
jgi:hypothetical protein